MYILFVYIQYSIYGSFGHLSTKIWKISNRYPGMRVAPFLNLKSRLFLDVLGAAMLLSRFLVWATFTLITNMQIVLIRSWLR